MLATASYLCLCWHLVFLLATALLFILTSNSLNLPTATALLWEAGQENVIIKKDETTYFQHFVQTHLPESIQFKPRYYNTKACWIDPIVHPPHGMTRLLLDFGRGPANCGRAVGKISERMETKDDGGPKMVILNPQRNDWGLKCETQWSQVQRLSIDRSLNSWEFQKSQMTEV